jgi:ubiquinol-cytochrome c reductase cytochrome c1 subunit
LKDIGLSDKQIKDNLLFTTEKVGETMKSSIDPRQAKDWFGANPPDLTLIARSRSAAGQGTGADYLYTYLRTYYVDASKATGWNNLAFPNVGMPHVLWELQGKREPIWEDVKSFGEGHGAAKKEDAHGAEAAHILKGWKQLEPGTMTSEQYDEAMGDLVNYLQWMSEPAQNSRVRIGFWVLSFLLVMTLFAWRLNAAFWKDVK